MAKADADRDLLFGILALQMDFISREALGAAVCAWVRDKSQPLDQFLVAQGALGRDEQAVLEPLVRRHLEVHGGNPARSLATLSTLDPARADLEPLTDPEVRSALVIDLSTALPPADGPDAPRAVGPGASRGVGPRFRILRPHARGGLGEVFVAHDEELNRQVALKEIQDRHADRSESRSRFVLEAEITGALEHPGVVPVYGLGQYPDGRPYYAMRFIQGETYSGAIQRFYRDQAADRDPGARTLAFRKLLGRFVDVCNTMAYAHSKGVLHRDLKPDNIMLGKYGETLVVDWGLAKAIGWADPGLPTAEEPVRPAADSDEVATLPGRAFGTPAFMSPEQAAGDLERMGPASDVYSLGATLYVVLTGRAAFQGGDPGSVLQEVRRGRFLPPRQIRRGIPPALEAICLKAMALEPEDRYGSPRTLADEIERWLADEPVSAWREPWAVKLRRWVGRHRTLVASGAAALLVAALAGGYVLYDARLRAAQRLAMALGRVDALGTADSREVPDLLRQLQPDRHLVQDRLRTLARAEPARSRRHLHAALALLPDDPTQADVLLERLQQVDTSPDELLIIRRGWLDNGHTGALAPRLWILLERTGTELSDAQLRAAGALALLDPRHPGWPALGPPIAAKLVRENPLLIGGWREVFQPVAGALTRPLHAHYRRHDRPEERALAFSLLFAFATRPANPSQTEDLVDLIAEADPAQFQQILSRLTDGQRAVAQLAAHLGEPGRFDDVRARRQGQITTALVILGQTEQAWPLFQHTADPGVRTELIHGLARFGAAPQEVIRRLDREPDVSARRALILCLGEFPADRFSAEQRQAVVSKLVRWYRDDPDPGVHSGIDRLLRQQWDQTRMLDRIDEELAGPAPPGDRDWYVNGQGQTFAVVRHPGEFLMGSAPGEAHRDPDESRHRRRIGRSFAIATREVTAAQYSKFLAENPAVADVLKDPELQAQIPTADCAMGGVDWYDAARYCNWLSRREGIPEAQWCYPRRIGPGMKLAADSLDHAGYRLPTEAEWEYACRAGSLASRPYGGSEAMLPEYVWYQSNADRRMHPVGRLKPNDLGLFDILGNAYEWTQDPYGPYPAGLEDPPAPDAAGPQADDSHDIERVLRGGSFLVPASFLRSAFRERYRPSDPGPDFGFRPARTVP